MSSKNQETMRKYRWLSTIYDIAVDNRWFNRARRWEFDLAQIQPNQRVLVVGIGTGLDIPFIPRHAEVVGIDLSREMLQRAKSKTEGRNVSLLEMNAEHLHFADSVFDVVILNLILSVVNNPRLTMREAWRVLKPSGNIFIIGKFSGKPRGRLRTAVSVLTRGIGGANLTLSLNDVIGDLPLRKIHEETGLLADVIQLTPTAE